MHDQEKVALSTTLRLAWKEAVVYLTELMNNVRDMW